MPKIIPTEKYKREAKKLYKKYKNLIKDTSVLEDILTQNPQAGIDLGSNLYKLRLKNSNKNKGKSSGYRIITYFIDENDVIYLVTIYDKSDTENISTEKLLDIINSELN
jgi:mRNA-degrading endonuclease RelE of RelBE toxin-antitoxin system